MSANICSAWSTCGVHARTLRGGGGGGVGGGAPPPGGAPITPGPPGGGPPRRWGGGGGGGELAAAASRVAAPVPSGPLELCSCRQQGRRVPPSHQQKQLRPRAQLPPARSSRCCTQAGGWRPPHLALLSIGTDQSGVGGGGRLHAGCHHALVHRQAFLRLHGRRGGGGEGAGGTSTRLPKAGGGLRLGTGRAGRRRPAWLAPVRCRHPSPT